jgi:hypothetical protein
MEELFRAQSTVEKEAQSAFLAVAQSQFARKDFAVAARCLDPMCKYLRLFDALKGLLSFVYPTTLSMIASIRALEPSLRATGPTGFASGADFRGLEDATAARAFDPTSSRIQFTLIQDIHLLAALLDPAVADLDTVGIDLLTGAVRALERYFVSSKFVIFKSEDLELVSVQQRVSVLRRQLTMYMSWSGLFANGVWASRKPGANVSVALLIANGWRPDGWWREVGSDTPEPCQVATRVLAIVPSS